MKIKQAILALLALMLVACPKPKPTCLDFQAITPFPQNFPGPSFTVTTVPPNPLVFTNPVDLSGNPVPIILEDRVEDQDGKPELYVGYSRDTSGYQPLFVEFPAASFPNGVQDVEVELMHTASVTILALDGGGSVIATATATLSNRAVLSLLGQNIRKLQFNAIETLVYKICWIPPTPPVCVDFEPPLVIGTQYGKPAGQSPGNLIFTTNGVSVSVYDFDIPGGVPLFEVASIHPAPGTFGSGQVIQINAINLEFDFSGIGFQPSQVDVDYLATGGPQNLSINGSPVFVGDFSAAPSVIGGVNLVFSPTPVPGNKTGKLTLKGTVKTLRIGGQEFWIDNVCAWK